MRREMVVAAARERIAAERLARSGIRAIALTLRGRAAAARTLGVARLVDALDILEHDLGKRERLAMRPHRERLDAAAIRQHRPAVEVVAARPVAEPVAP